MFWCKYNMGMLAWEVFGEELNGVHSLVKTVVFCEHMDDVEVR